MVPVELPEVPLLVDPVPMLPVLPLGGVVVFGAVDGDALGEVVVSGVVADGFGLMSGGVVAFGLVVLPGVEVVLPVVLVVEPGVCVVAPGVCVVAPGVCVVAPGVLVWLPVVPDWPLMLPVWPVCAPGVADAPAPA